MLGDRGTARGVPMFGKDFERCQGVGSSDFWEPAVSDSPEPVTLAPAGDSEFDVGAPTPQMLFRGCEVLP